MLQCHNWTMASLQVGHTLTFGRLIRVFCPRSPSTILFHSCHCNSVTVLAQILRDNYQSSIHSYRLGNHLLSKSIITPGRLTLMVRDCNTLMPVFIIRCSKMFPKDLSSPFLICCYMGPSACVNCIISPSVELLLDILHITIKKRWFFFMGWYLVLTLLTHVRCMSEKKWGIFIKCRYKFTKKTRHFSSPSLNHLLHCFSSPALGWVWASILHWTLLTPCNIVMSEHYSLQ